jgi:hypothetical protein
MTAYFDDKTHRRANHYFLSSRLAKNIPLSSSGKSSLQVRVIPRAHGDDVMRASAGDVRVTPQKQTSGRAFSTSALC